LPLNPVFHLSSAWRAEAFTILWIVERNTGWRPPFFFGIEALFVGM
jgi:hypothetical protein